MTSFREPLHLLPEPAPAPVDYRDADDWKHREVCEASGLPVVGYPQASAEIDYARQQIAQARNREALALLRGGPLGSEPRKRTGNVSPPRSDGPSGPIQRALLRAALECESELRRQA